MVRILAPLLGDRRNTAMSYAVYRDEQVSPALPTRVCDEAAATLAERHKTLSFVMEGSHDNLDRQIETLRRKIAAMGTSKP